MKVLLSLKQFEFFLNHLTFVAILNTSQAFETNSFIGPIWGIIAAVSRDGIVGNHDVIIHATVLYHRA